MLPESLSLIDALQWNSRYIPECSMNANFSSTVFRPAIAPDKC